MVLLAEMKRFLPGDSMNKYCFFLIFLLFFCSQASASADKPATWHLDTAVHFALANSPDTHMAGSRMEAAAASSRQARSAFYPRLDLSSAYTATNNPMYSFGNILNQGAFSNTIDFNDPGRTDNLSLQAKIRYQLYNGGSNQAALQAAEDMEKGSAFDLAALHNQLSFEVIRVFWRIIQSAEMTEARTSAVLALEESLKTARAKFEAGVFLKAEVLTLEAQLSQAREQLISSRHSHEMARRLFLNLLGLEFYPFTISMPEKCLDDTPVPLHSDYSARPELLGLDARIKAARAHLRMARGGHRPDISTFAGYQIDHGSVTGSGGNSWMGGVQLDLPLFDGSLTDAKIDEAGARLAELQALRNKISLAIDLEVQQARLALKDSIEQLAVTEKMVEQARESAELNRARFKAGVILSSELIDSEDRLTEALVRQSVASAAGHIALADLRRSLTLEQFPGKINNKDQK